MSSQHDPTKNHLLAGLECAEFHRLSPYLELVGLARGEVLYQSGGKMMYVYFPITATISIDYVLENGATSEIASIGNEGLLGVALLMGGFNAPSRAVVQLPGHAYRLSASRLMDEFYHKGPLLRLLLRYTQTRLTQISQLAVCNSHHTTEQRLCRWLLQMLDRSSSNEFVVTQEAIAAILGVRREGITDAVRRLKNLGIVQWRRGHVAVLNRAGLHTHVCECYAVLCNATARLLPERTAGQRKIEHPWCQRNALTSRRSAVGERRQRGAGSQLADLDETPTALEFA